MARIKWDEIGYKEYEIGVDRCVFFPMDDTGKYEKGEPWNGVTEVAEKPSGAEPTKLWADNRKYITVYSAEEFAYSITAYMFPDGFLECDGAAQIAKGVYARQQKRRKFGFTWRSLVGNDVQGNDYGYKLHVAYGCSSSPSEKTNSTVNDSSDIPTMSWEVSTDSVEVPGFKPTGHLEIWSKNADPAKLKEFEDMLYGTDGESGTESKLPSLEEIIEIFGEAVVAG